MADFFASTLAPRRGGAAASTDNALSWSSLLAPEAPRTPQGWTIPEAFIAILFAAVTCDGEIASVEHEELLALVHRSRALKTLTTEQLASYYISTGTGKLVPLSTIATIQNTTTPRNLARFQQLNCATIGLVPRPGVTLGDALTWLNNEAKQVFPEGFSADYKGELRQYVQEGSSLITTFALAIIVIFLVLAAQYESWRDPFIVMLAVPLSLAGALLFLFLGFATINIYTQVGLITLVGLITKHGILMVDFANGLQEKGAGIRDAIAHAAGVRLRPILMTTAAMVLGVLPLVFAEGAGAESRFSMGLVIATGMSIGTLFTLFVVPVFYTLFAEDYRAPASATPAPTTH